MNKYWKLIAGFMCIMMLFMGEYINFGENHNNKKGIYVRIESNQVYALGISTSKESSCVCNANGSSMKSNELLNLFDQLRGNTSFELVAYDQNEQPLLKKNFNLTEGYSYLEIEIGPNKEIKEIMR